MSESCDYEALRPFATERQSEYLDALAQHGSQRKAAKACGVNSRTIERAVSRLKRKAALNGWSPEHDLVHPAPPGMELKGASLYYPPEDGQPGQWVKFNKDREQAEAIFSEVLEALREDIPREKLGRVPKPKNPDPDLLNLYVLADPHIGQMSWGEETGDDWDTKIAEDVLVRWFEKVIVSSPEADTALLSILGDLLHWDGLKAITPNAGHLLDADTRFAKLVRIVLRLLRRVVRMLLQKHQHVHIICTEGNHDESAYPWLREHLDLFYEDEERVTVDTSPSPYHAYEHGQTSLFFHHGHIRKPKAVDDVFVAQFRELFGRTTHSYAHLGHMHHRALIESNLMVVEQHPTLAAKDTHSARGGYHSGRAASCITYSREHGEVGRVVIGPEMACA